MSETYHIHVCPDTDEALASVIRALDPFNAGRATLSDRAWATLAAFAQRARARELDTVCP